MTLKTLKEIEEIDNVGAVLPQDLREEAIKWIKAIDTEATKDRFDSEHYTRRARRELQQWAIGQVSWIMTFFNIQESDLK